jgi:hypothetical protein
MVETYVPARPCKRGHRLRYASPPHACVTCARARVRAWVKAHRKRKAKADKAWREANAERCKANDRAEYLRNRKERIRQARLWAEAHPRLRKKIARSWYQKNADLAKARAAAWTKAHPTRAKARVRAWKQTHPASVLADVRVRQTRKLNATPAWLTKADFRRMERYYEKAARLTRETGVQYQVDHIVPLRGKTVCGLHTPQNLRVIPAAKNYRKANAFKDTGAAARGLRRASRDTSRRPATSAQTAVAAAASRSAKSRQRSGNPQRKSDQ